MHSIFPKMHGPTTLSALSLTGIFIRLIVCRSFIKRAGFGTKESGYLARDARIGFDGAKGGLEPARVSHHSQTYFSASTTEVEQEGIDMKKPGKTCGKAGSKPPDTTRHYKKLNPVETQDVVEQLAV